MHRIAPKLAVVWICHRRGGNPELYSDGEVQHWCPLLPLYSGCEVQHNCVSCKVRTVDEIIFKTVPDIVVSITEELSKYIDGHYS